MSVLTTIFGFVSNIIQPVVDLIDDLSTSDEEKLILRNELAKIENAFNLKVMEYETKLLEAKSSIIIAEAASSSWLTKTWRPLMMVWFGLLLGLYWFDITPENLTQETIDSLFLLLQIGIGGYIGGRSIERILPKLLNRRNNENS